MTTMQDGSAIAETTEIREGEYGDKVAVIEPGGAEFIPLNERHGKPLGLFWTWMSPNFEFATVFVGVICILFFGMSFTQAVAAIVLGTVLGSATQAVLSARGPEYGVPQMILSRISFGFLGNALPAGINAIIAGIGWFAVNSVSGALALNTLLHLNKVVCLLIIVVAQIAIATYGHNLVHLYEKVMFPLLAVAFLLAAIWTFSKGHYGGHGGGGGFGGFMASVAATFGYACGWNPYAADYTRYMAPDTNKKATALWSGLGVAISCIALEIIGAASATIGAKGATPTAQFTNPLPTAVADITLIAIAIGAVAANVLNIYSGAMSFSTLGIKLSTGFQRAIVAVVFGMAGFLVAWNGLSDAGSKYENFLLIIAYWIGPWLAVFLVDQLINKGNHADVLYDRSYTNWAGPIAMFVGGLVSILLFSYQTKFTGYVARQDVVNYIPKIGDLTFEVGFVLSAVLYYFLFKTGLGPRRKSVTLPN